MQLPILLIAFGCISNTLTAQFYNIFKNSNVWEREIGAAVLNDGFVFGYTVTNNAHNFHQNILLVKTNSAGTIVYGGNNM